MTVSMKDVAKLAGVSTATVSYVVNNSRSVKKETRKNVEEAIKKLGYQVNPIARKLRSGKSRQVLFLVSNLKSYFYIGIAKGLSSILEKKGYCLVFMDSNEDPETERRNLRLAILESYAGLVIVPVNEDWSSLKNILGNTPCIFIDRRPKNIPCDFVLSKNFEGGYDLTEVLIKKGHKRIGFFTDRSDSTMEDRIGGYEEALRSYGIQIDKNLEVFAPRFPTIYEKFDFNSKWNYLLENLFANTDITALITGNGFFLFYIMEFFDEKNIKIPQDIEVATFDNPFWLSLKNRSIISKPQNVNLIGETAASVLLHRMDCESCPYREYRIDMLPLLIGSSIVDY